MKKLNLNNSQIENNYLDFQKRIEKYKSYGFDFYSSRKLLLDNVLPLKGKVLEIGTGRGYMTLVLTEQGYELIAIDKNKESLKKAASTIIYKNLFQKVNFLIMDGCNLAFRNSSFDNIFCINTLHHIKNIKKIIRQMDKVISGRGKIIISDFNKKGRNIVNKIHQKEGGEHSHPIVDKNYVRSELERLNFIVRESKDRFHWFLFSKKRSK